MDKSRSKSMFKREGGDWLRYRQLESCEEEDFHPPECHGAPSERMPYWQRMQEVEEDTRAAIEDAQERGLKYVIFTHGWSTSRIGMTTSRSVVRRVMRSKAATPFIIRSECIQHQSVFVAAIRPKKSSKDGDAPSKTSSSEQDAGSV